MHRRYEKINIPIELVRAFVAIVDCGSYSKAAAALALGQSAISAQMKRLQLVVGGELFHRVDGIVVTTELGTSVLSHARKLIQSNDQILGLSGSNDIEPMRLGISAHYDGNGHLQGQRGDAWDSSP
jgi:DNA-binding transcriptional LysR family regulator